MTPRVSRTVEVGTAYKCAKQVMGNESAKQLGIKDAALEDFLSLGGWGWGWGGVVFLTSCISPSIIKGELRAPAIR